MNEERRKFLRGLFREPIFLVKENSSSENETAFSEEESEDIHTGLFAQQAEIPIIGNTSASIGILCDITHDNVANELLPSENELLQKIFKTIPLDSSDVFMMLLNFEKVNANRVKKIIASLHSENSIRALFAFGENISQQLFRKPLSHSRGKIQSLNGIQVVCTHKLQALNDDVSLKRETNEDMKLFRTLIMHSK